MIMILMISWGGKSKDETACEMWPFYIVRLSSVHSEQVFQEVSSHVSSFKFQVEVVEELLMTYAYLR